MTDTLNLLFLCTRNACCWQKAKGRGKHFAAGRFEVQSAGIDAAQVVERVVH